MTEEARHITGGKEKCLSFKKEERLHHRSLVENLFRKGKNIYEFPFRVTWLAMTAEKLESCFRNGVPTTIGPLQMMVTVPKKKRKRAVDRVLMRRRIREAYRLNRIPLKVKVMENTDIRTLQLGIVYIHNANLPYSTIEERLCKLLEKLKEKV